MFFADCSSFLHLGCENGERAPKWRGEHGGVSLAVRQSDGLIPWRAYVRTLSQAGRMRYFTVSATLRCRRWARCWLLRRCRRRTTPSAETGASRRTNAAKDSKADCRLIQGDWPYRLGHVTIAIVPLRGNNWAQVLR